MEDVLNRYEQDGSINNLLRLIQVLEENEDWASLSEHAATLFEKTGDLRSFELFLRSLEEEGLHEREYNLLQEHASLRAQSTSLKALWAWSLYRAGEFGAAAEALAELRVVRSSQSDRNLFVNLAISSGRWEDLMGYVEAEYEERRDRSGTELLRVASIASAVKSGRTADLARAAVAASAADPHVLVGAYMVMTSIAGEETEEAAKWLQTAAELSTEGGPLQAVSLEQLLDQAPDWEQGQREVVEKLVSGDLPLFAAARFLRRTITDMLVLQGVANRREHDPVLRVAVPIRRGVERQLVVGLRSIAIEPVALLTLSLAECLGKVLDCLDRVVIPHDTLSLLFGDRQGVAYHQPSQVRQAKFTRDALSTGLVHQLVRAGEGDEALGRQVGSELALLLTEAALGASEGDSHLVVHSPPIYKSGSLMKEVADLGDHAQFLVSCTQVVSTLEALGVLRQDEVVRARSFLRLQEPDQPGAPEIAPNSTLYLDGLSFGFLHHSGVVPKLSEAGFQVILSPEVVEQANRLLRHADLTDEVAEVVEITRKDLTQRISEGKICVARELQSPSEEDAFARHPSASVFELSAGVDAVVSDDRSLGRYLTITNEGHSIPVLGTTELLMSLAGSGLVDSGEVVAALGKWRTANLALLPTTAAELEEHLASSKLNADGSSIVESPELRAIRESILGVRATDLLQMPSEGHWLFSTMQAIREAIRSQWRTDTPPELAARRSDWLLELYDLRGWAHRFPAQLSGQQLRDLHARSLLQLVFPLTDVPEGVADGYLGWISDVLGAIENEDPTLFERMVASATDSVHDAAHRGSDK